MPEYVAGALLAVAIYSLILTVVLLYKDNSGYFMVKALDVIISGPVAWLLILIMGVIVRPIYAAMRKNHICAKEKKQKPYKKKGQRYISRVVGKVVKNYSKKKYHNDYFDFTNSSYYDCDFKGYEGLLVKKARNEWLNKRFVNLMWNQKDETVEELKKYFLEENSIVSNNPVYTLREGQFSKAEKLKGESL